MGFTGVFRCRPAIFLSLWVTLFGAIFSSFINAQELSAYEVMMKVENRYTGDSSVGQYTMVLIDRRERQRVRNLRIYKKDFGKDNKALSLFETPADIRGTAYLNFDWENQDRDDDSWLYLPALQRVKRIASSDTSDSFLGSDFTYADINGYELDWYNYSFVNESESLDGFEVWVVEAIPKAQFKHKAEDATGYSKMKSWIRKDNFVQVRGQVWELRGNKIKYFNSTEIELIDDIWTTKRLQVIATRNGRQEHASVLQINSIDYNVKVDDSSFTTEYMQRGLD
ncbi:MAG TPA: outer membrane lipoprotein-sorting protein [Gammaproteobacteria bacterium]|nr:outer membrane lipoprotein-sorting protein [Gammaproteobacteria bacterium]|tara:strand:- start:861 stop:1706 length:846 start_codon:yes stop_codon:yes gene_type:complete